MPNEYVDIAKIWLEAPSLGLVELQDIKSLKVRSKRETKRVSTMNKLRRARGYRRGNKEVEIDLSSELAVTPEVDWEALYEAEEVFQIYWERDDGGKRRWAVDCTVTDIEEEEDEAGESGLSISIMALDNVPLN